MASTREQLAQAVREACRRRGDSQHQAAELLAECLTLDPAAQRDLLDHFEHLARAPAWPATPDQGPAEGHKFHHPGPAPNFSPKDTEP